LRKLFDIIQRADIRSASIGSLLLKFATAALGVLNAVLLARMMSMEGLGYYVLVYSTMILLLVPVNMGIPNLITRYMSKYMVHDQWKEIKGLMIKTNVFVLVMVLVLLFLAFVSYFLWWSRYDAELVDSFIIGFGLIPVIGFGSLWASALRGMKLVVLANISDQFLRTFLFSILIVACLITKVEMSPLVAVSIQLIASAMSAMVALLLVVRKLLPELKGLRPIYCTKEWIKQTIPFSINGGVQTIRSRMVNYILIGFGSVESVALYEVATKGSILVSFTLDAMASAISSFVSSYYEKGNMQVLQKILRKAGRVVFLFSAPVATLFILGGEGLIALIFGPEYTGAYIPLAIMCVGQLISALVGLVGLLLNMTGGQAVFSRNNVIMMVLQLVLSIPMVIWFDVVGAAIVSALLVIVQNLTLLHYVKKHLKLNTAIINF